MTGGFLTILRNNPNITITIVIIMRMIRGAGKREQNHVLSFAKPSGCYVVVLKWRPTGGDCWKRNRKTIDFNTDDSIIISALQSEQAKRPNGKKGEKRHVWVKHVTFEQVHTLIILLFPGK